MIRNHSLLIAVKLKDAKSKLLILFYQSNKNKTVWLSPKQRKIIIGLP